jgi:hypothetical protein
LSQQQSHIKCFSSSSKKEKDNTPEAEDAPMKDPPSSQSSSKVNKAKAPQELQVLQVPFRWRDS